MSINGEPRNAHEQRRRDAVSCLTDDERYALLVAVIDALTERRAVTGSVLDELIITQMTTHIDEDERKQGR